MDVKQLCDRYGQDILFSVALRGIDVHQEINLHIYDLSDRELHDLTNVQ